MTVKTNEKEYTEQVNYPLFDVCGLMVSLLTSSAVDRVFEPPLFDVGGVMISLVTSGVVNRVFEAPLFDVGGVMVSLLTSGVVDRVFEPPSGQDKDYKIGIFCFSTQHLTF